MHRYSVPSGYRGEIQPQTSSPADCLHGNGVHLPDDGGAIQAIGKDVLAIEDRLRFIEARQDRLLRHFEQELVPGGHRVEQPAQLQVLRQRRCLRRQAPLKIEIPVPVHQISLHDAMRSFTLS